MTKVAEPQAVPKDSQLINLSRDLITIHEGHNSRKRFDSEKMKELVASVKRHGILQPLLVRKVGTMYILVAGERRLRAAQEANVGTIPVMVVEIDELQAKEMQAIENLQRDDLTPLEEASAYKALLERTLGGKWDHAGKKMLPSKDFINAVDVVARQVGKPPRLVLRYLRLLELPAVVQKMIEDGQLLNEHGWLMLTVPTEFWPEVTKHLVDSVKSKDEGARWSSMGAHDKTISVASLERYLDEKVAKDLRNAPFPTNISFAGEIACTACPHNTACQTSLLPNLDDKSGTCRQPKCWIKKRETVYRQIRDKKSQDGQFKDLAFAGFGRLSSWNGALPDAIGGSKVIKANTPVMARAKELLKDPKKKDAVGWAIVKPAKDTKSPEVKTVLVIKDPKAFAGVAGAQKMVEQSDRGEDPAVRKRKGFDTEVRVALGYLLVRMTFKMLTPPKPKRDAVSLMLDTVDVDDQARYREAAELLKLPWPKPKKKTLGEALRALKLEQAVQLLNLAEALGWHRGYQSFVDNYGLDPIKTIPTAAFDAAYEKFKDKVSVTSWGVVEIKRADALAAADFVFTYKPAVKPEAKK